MNLEPKLPPFSPASGGVLVAVRLTPKASTSRIGNIRTGADGRQALKVSVTAPPEGGKANAALIALLAKEWKMTKGGITIERGARGRDKTVFLAGDAEVLMGKLRAWSRRRKRHG